VERRSTTRPPRANVSTGPPPPRKIVLMDDSALTLATAESHLSDRGYDVRTAASLNELERTLEEWAPDVLLADVGMPEVSGVELCKRLKRRSDTSHVIVVLFSNLLDSELETLAEKCGADGFVSKRAGLNRLGEKLDALLAEVVW
jgi:DNA-binding response OmpR family regulator